MPLSMNRGVFITCAVTGSGATHDKSPHVPRSPEEIASSASQLADTAERLNADVSSFKLARRTEIGAIPSTTAVAAEPIDLY